MRRRDSNGRDEALLTEVTMLRRRVAELRHSRLVLMDLLILQARGQSWALQQLQRENRRLRRRQGMNPRELV